MAAAEAPTAAEALATLAPEARGRLELVRELAAALALPTWWAGGGVRDLLLGRPDLDLDLVVESGAERLALALAARLGGHPRVHRRFLTACVEAEDGSRIDVATARRELYDAPAALPRVEPATLAEDLGRRDFAVNAIALRLHPEPLVWADPHGGLEDLRAGRLRILHGRSFVDDPTRILRGVRFETRLGFALDAATEAAARAAVAAGHLGALSGERLRAELDRALESWTALARAVGRLEALGVWRALGAARAADPEWLAEAARRSRSDAGTPEPVRRLQLVAIWLATALDRPERAAVGARLAAARDLEAVVEGPERVDDLVSRIESGAPPLDHVLVEGLEGMSPEERCLAAARSRRAGEAIDVAERKRRAVRLAISGADLLAAGVPAGPSLGRALRRTREARLDGRLAAEQELEFALREAAEPGS